jgi:hypothetical protein
MNEYEKRFSQYIFCDVYLQRRDFGALFQHLEELSDAGIVDPLQLLPSEKAREFFKKWYFHFINKS